MRAYAGRLGTVVMLAAFMAGCSGEILNEIRLDTDKVILTGARQRIITNVQVGPGSKAGQVIPKQIVCAEPSPDVALAVANAFGLGVSVISQGSGAIDMSRVEGLAQLVERTATIQLMRDGLYRACEAYANGAISAITYAMIISRLDETLVTLRMGELAAGDFGRSLAMIAGMAKANSESEGASAEAATVAEAIGAINRAVENVAPQLTQMHKQFLDDKQTDALMVACIHSMEHERRENLRQSQLSRICESILMSVAGELPVPIQAPIQAPIQQE